MESIAANGDSSNILWIVIGVTVALVGFFTLLQSLAMKFAVRLCAGEPIGWIYATVCVWGSAIAGGVASAAITYASEEPGGWTPLLGAVGSSVVVLCLLLKMDPLRAFGVYLVQILLGGVMMFVAVLLLSFGAAFAVPAETMEQLRASAEGKLGEIHKVSAGQQGEIGGGLDQLLKLSGERKDLENGVEVPLQIGDQNGNPFFKNDSEASVKTISNAVEAKQPVVSPFDNKIQSNPFSK